MPELVDIYNAIGQWLLEHPETERRVDVFALEQFARYRKDLKEYIGKHAGRVEILESQPRIHLSDPADIKFTVPGHREIHVPFIPNNIRLYKRYYGAFRRQLDSFNAEELGQLKGLLGLEIKYLRGCDLQWVPEAAGKFSSLAMLQDKALTVHLRVGTGGGSKESGDDSSSDVEVIGLVQPSTSDFDDSFEDEKPRKRKRPNAYMQVKPQKSTQQLKGRATGRKKRT
jgi:hypothetical protein